MQPSATILFIAQQDTSAIVLAAHMLALASNDRFRTAAVTLGEPWRTAPVISRLLTENMLPSWWLPTPVRFEDLDDRMAAADMAISLEGTDTSALREILPNACLAGWSLPALPTFEMDEQATLFEWRCLYAAVSRRISLMASLSPRALSQLQTNPVSTGNSLRLQGI